MILAIDPGNEQSAYAVLNEELFPVSFGKVDNRNLLDDITNIVVGNCIKNAAIEMVACYGMAVGKTVFETCVYIGKLTERLENNGVEVTYIYRKDEKMNLCHTMKAKDGNISQALRDRFGEKGTIKNKGWFFGFKADIWQAYAVGVTYNDIYCKTGTNIRAIK